MRIALVSTPWPLFNRPSIQLGSLKAFLSERLPEVKVDALHLYLLVAAALGYPLYEEISQSTWLAEPLYGALLYPDRSELIEKAWTKRASRTRYCKGWGFKKIHERLQAISLEILERHDWFQYRLIGFSACFSQLTSTLYFIRSIREMAPEVPVVVGGSSCAGDLGKALLNTFPDITYAIEGEGELPLLKLIQQIENSDLPNIQESGDSRFRDPEQILRMDELPTPNYDDYFQTLKGLGPSKKFHARIPVEMSRGCWWNRCAFCNLNLQWKGYRSKSSDKMISEMISLSERYEVLGFSFMDNLLPQKNLDGFFRRITEFNRDFELFAEIRATTPSTTLEAMGQAGMREIQVGIEALSTTLLKKINKGTTAMDNIEIMKNCERPGFPALTGNLIMEFPGSDEKDVDETLRVLDFVRPFHPLKAIPFWLGYGSPVWSNQRYYGIKRSFNHPFYRSIFPQRTYQSLLTMIQGYHGGVMHQKKLWKPVKAKVSKWAKEYAVLHQVPRSGPILSYMDGGDFMIIRERRPGDHPMTHKLTGASRKIYLFCETQRSIQEVTQHFPSIAADKIESFLRMMVEKRLMFQEGGRYLSLAVPARTKTISNS